jgi:tetratricopeptide (TPR) repeat protein
VLYRIDSWLDCVRKAQANCYPGDILTLAMNAPTRLHEARILYEAAMALINLGRYAAAEPVLRNVIRLNPAQADAQVQLALVLSQLNKPLAAEHQLRKILQQQFWCTTTLAGLLFMDGKHDEASKGFREACAIPAATSFQLKSFQGRLELLKGLEVQSGFVEKTLKIVTDAMGDRNHQCSCKRVFLWSGYAIDEPKRPSPRFPADRVEAVTTEIKETLQRWELKSSDLAICGGTTESDIIFAEGHRRCARSFEFDQRLS